RVAMERLAVKNEPRDGEKAPRDLHLTTNQVKRLCRSCLSFAVTMSCAYSTPPLGEMRVPGGVSHAAASASRHCPQWRNQSSPSTFVGVCNCGVRIARVWGRRQRRCGRPPHLWNELFCERGSALRRACVMYLIVC
ncbi:uncharacterized protein Tco025E_10075, partial [Trypanosoma conorhini]